MECPGCGTKNAEDAKICVSCGRFLFTAPPSATSAELGTLDDLRQERYDYCVGCLQGFFHEDQVCPTCGKPALPSLCSISFDEWRLLQNELTGGLVVIRQDDTVNQGRSQEALILVAEATLQRSRGQIDEEIYHHRLDEAIALMRGKKSFWKRIFGK